MHCERRMSWFLLLFDKQFSNYLPIPSKYSNIMLSICKISLKKNIICYKQMKMVDCSFFIKNFCYIFSNADGIEKQGICWQKFLTLFYSITRSTCCNVQLNIIMKRWKYRMANILNCYAIFFTKLEAVESRSRSFWKQKP